MNKQKDILYLEDIKVLVNTIYGKLQQDDRLADLFNEIIQDNRSKH